MSRCTHPSLLFYTHQSNKVRYKQPTDQVLREAVYTSGPSERPLRKSRAARDERPKRTHALDRTEVPPWESFPALLGLPGDALDQDSDCEGQSTQEWLHGEYRNEVTKRRKTIYVVAPPTISADVSFAQSWTTPQTSLKPQGAEDLPPPNVGHLVEYLQAFYHGLPVKVLQKPQLQLTSWEDESNSKAATKKQTDPPIEYIGLSTTSQSTRIRVRPSLDGLFSGQLNLNDLLDVAISILPADAYALLMLAHHDLYEDEEDDFCCGRAYGGSRVAVVSAARYRPGLDDLQQVDRLHSWPASHCERFVRSQVQGKPSKRRKRNPENESVGSQYAQSAIVAAVSATNALSTLSIPAELTTLWLGRVCKTASHELGHCFGIAHCSYFACIMQGTASLAEDSRQPPYLCPVDLVKVLRATGASEGERYGELVKVCDKWRGDRMFDAFAAWLRVRMDDGYTVPV